MVKIKKRKFPIRKYRNKRTGKKHQLKKIGKHKYATI